MLRGVMQIVVALLAIAVLVAGVALGLNAWKPNNDGQTALELLAGLNWLAIGSIVTAVATVVLALFAIRATRTASQAIRAVSAHTAASVAAGEASIQAAQAASRAVEAAALAIGVTTRTADASDRSIQVAERAIGENRRSAALAGTPILSLGRPRPARGAGGLQIAADAHSNGPGVALNISLEVEVQERDGEPFTHAPGGSAATTLLNTGETVTLRVPAQDLQNKFVSWAAPWPDGADPLPPPNLFVPVRMRFRLAWLSPAGARATQTTIWETSSLDDDTPQSWRFEELRIEPAGGEPLVVGP